MRPQVESIAPEPGTSLRLLQIDQHRFDSVWHCHQECELTWIHEGAGDRLIGDSLESFSESDLVLLGSGLPHFWRTDSSWQNRSRATVIQFAPELIKDWPASDNELHGAARLLESARRGLAFQWDQGMSKALENLKTELINGSGWKRLRAFLDTMDLLVVADADGRSRPLSSPGPGFPRPDQTMNSPLQRVFAYVFQNDGATAHFEEAARRASMTPASFSRFFHRSTGKTFTRFLQDVRLGSARRRLLEDVGSSISEIAFATGFGSLSTFNRLFLERHGISPREWRVQARAPR